MDVYINIITRAISRIYPTGFYLYYTLAAISFIFLKKKLGIKEKMLGTYSMLAFAAIICPWFCALIWRFLRYGFVYWRLLWVVPYAILIAFACTELIFSSEKKSFRTLTAALLTAALIMGGTNVYTAGNFENAENSEKLPQITLTTMAVINQNAAETGNSYKRVAAPVDILCEIRQCDATILQYGSREMEPQSRNEYKFEGYYYKLMDGLIKDYRNWIIKIMKCYEINYIVFPTSYELSDHMEEGGAEQIYSDGEWEIWYMPKIRNTKHAGEYVWLSE